MTAPNRADETSPAKRASETYEVEFLGSTRSAAVTYQAPTSKSVTNRALVIAALADGTSVLRHPLESDDTAAMQGALTAFGIRVGQSEGQWIVHGGGGRLATPTAAIDARLSGTTMRFVTALAALAPGSVTVTGQPSLLRRPIGSLVRSLNALGAKATAAGDLPPVQIAGGGLSGGSITVDGAATSQFATAVLLVAPYARTAVNVRAADVSALGYVELTVKLMADAGASVSNVGHAEWTVAPGAYAAQDFEIEYDASAAAHLVACVMATGGQILVENARVSTLQPDAAITNVFEAMGAHVAWDPRGLILEAPLEIRPVDVDLGPTPDQLPTVAALAALANGTSTFRNILVARGHETDRVAALAAELPKLGVDVVETRDTLIVRGGGPLRPARLRTYDDHRLAMAFATLGARLPGLVVEDAGCVGKTYPRFWDDCTRAGIRWRRVPA